MEVPDDYLLEDTGQEKNLYEMRSLLKSKTKVISGEYEYMNECL